MTGLEIFEARIFIGHLGRPPNLNIERQGNRYKRHDVVTAWREAAAKAWANLALPPRTDRVTVCAQPHYRTYASRPDTGACLPAVKAALDGIVDTGYLSDDNPDYVMLLCLGAPVMASDHGDGLMVWIRSWLGDEREDW